MKCIHAVKSLPGVQLDSEKTLIAGFSGGASSAPYISSYDSLFRAFAVLHGGAIPNGFGSNRVRGWFSAGEADSLRPPGGVQAAMEELRREGWSAELQFRVFPGGHALSEREKRELIRWWLQR
jgi:predicted esterase